MIHAPGHSTHEQKSLQALVRETRIKLVMHLWTQQSLTVPEIGAAWMT